MSTNNADLIQRAYQAYASGDLTGMLEFVDPDLEWTYLDPTLEHPTPAGLPRPLGAGADAAALGRARPAGRARGGHQQRRAGHGRRADARDDTHFSRGGADRVYSVFTVREGRIVALRDCRDRHEALQLAGIQT
jgi:ketosteroid isomerase-like protein